MPIPEAHVIGMIIGTILYFSFPKSLFQMSSRGYVIGWPLVAAGIGLCIWSVIEAKDTNISKTNVLIKSGPYALSRNPMYVGWTLIYLGYSFILNSVWVVSMLPFVMAYQRFVDIRQEEQFLDEKFGDEYRHYKQQVRRYF